MKTKKSMFLTSLSLGFIFLAIPLAENASAHSGYDNDRRYRRSYTRYDRDYDNGYNGYYRGAQSWRRNQPYWWYHHRYYDWTW